MKTREVHLAARPKGWPTPEDFAVVEADLTPPEDGEVLVRNLFMSVDPYMRGRMNDAKSYVPPFRLDQVMTGGAVGEVVESRHPGLAEGDVVLHDLGWRELAKGRGKWFRKLEPVEGVPLSAYLGALGMPGLTAYVGLLDIAGMKKGDTVFVSGAAGAVGSLAGQIARQRGAARVIGSAGSAEKVAYLSERLGFDAAFDYKSGKVWNLLAEAAPDGIDVYFDNVGGEHLEAAIDSFNQGGRAALCGAISAYNATEPPAAPRNLISVVGKRLTLKGFIVSDHGDRLADFTADMGAWIRDGKITFEETVYEGVDNAVDAFLSMLGGKNLGKMLVRL
ncbi:NADP-dependent oxidoreductase [Actinomadura sp. DC4]|uniref:NADP-dependent oxidoreductase n=1 Tax=Actinomadura sp. DC4 TaxID=3055069 RepID=UPI0025B1A61F|nr:NADP-dependent oxidoreductase [Actinomadura sp. DC4]MDN3351317.1 NADP-dependent oxidoreductase [Actinomadura sp. DC4]